MEHNKNRKSLPHCIFLFFGGVYSRCLNVVPFDILEIQAKTGHNLHKFPRDISLDRQWLDLFTENEQILSGRQVTQSLLCRLSQNTFCERNGAEETNQVNGWSCPNYSTRNKTDSRLRSPKKSQEERATECCFFSLQTKGHGQAKLFIN